MTQTPRTSFPFRSSLLAELAVTAHNKWAGADPDSIPVMYTNAGVFRDRSELKQEWVELSRLTDVITETVRLVEVARIAVILYPWVAPPADSPMHRLLLESVLSYVPGSDGLKKEVSRSVMNDPDGSLASGFTPRKLLNVAAAEQWPIVGAGPFHRVYRVGDWKVFVRTVHIDTWDESVDIALAALRAAGYTPGDLIMLSSDTEPRDVNRLEDRVIPLDPELLQEHFAAATNKGDI